MTEKEKLTELLNQISKTLPFEEFYKFSQDKCFTIFGTLEAKNTSSVEDLMTTEILYLFFNNYSLNLSFEIIGKYCHCFILIQMVWARLVQLNKNAEILELIVMFVSRFLDLLSSKLEEIEISKSGNF